MTNVSVVYVSSYVASTVQADAIDTKTYTLLLSKFETLLSGSSKQDMILHIVGQLFNHCRDFRIAPIWISLKNRKKTKICLAFLLQFSVKILFLDSNKSVEICFNHSIGFIEIPTNWYHHLKTQLIYLKMSMLTSTC